MDKPKAVMFDLDDTLISFEGVAEEAWAVSCREFVGRCAVPVTVQALLEEIGRSRVWYWSDPERHRTGRQNQTKARREIVRLALQNFDITDQKLVCALADTYTEYRDARICLFPNTMETLKSLRHAGYRLGLITNGSSDSQRGKLERFGLTPFFEIILIEQELGIGKPDARVYRYALSLLDLPVHEVWMVGDNLSWDIQAPKSLGIYTVWHDYEKTGLPADAPVVPDKIIRDLAQLKDELCSG